MKRGDETRQKIMDAAIVLARSGMASVTGRAVAQAAGIKHPALAYHFPTTAALRIATAKLVMERRDPEGVARLILDKHPIADRLTREERAGYLEAAAG